MSSFKEVRQTIESGIGYTMVSTDEISRCFDYQNMLHIAVASVRRVNDELYRADQFALPHTTEALGHVDAAIATLASETGPMQTSDDEPILLIAAAQINKALEKMELVAMSDKALVGKDGVVMAKMSSLKGVEYINSAAIAADKAHEAACMASSKYHEAKPDISPATVAAECQSQIKTLANETLGSLVCKLSNLREMVSTIELFSTPVSETAGTLALLGAARDKAVAEIDVPAVIAETITADLHRASGQLEMLIAGRKLSQQAHENLSLSLSEITGLCQSAVEQTLRVLKQPQAIVQAARALISRSI